VGHLADGPEEQLGDIRRSENHKAKGEQNTKRVIFSLLISLSAWVVVSLGLRENRPVGALAAASPPSAESVVRGGLLYDTWWRVVPGASEPKDDQPLWALQTTNKRKGSVTWRCKECHGWDYKGKDGAYGSGSRFTGFPGVWDAAQKKGIEELAAILRGSPNRKHDFSSVLRPADITDLANFLKNGLVNMAQYVDYKAKKPIGGDAGRGKTIYAFCAACHGPDGKKLNFGTDKDPEYVGTVAKANPQEFLHKVWVGQPGSAPAMPAALVMGWTIHQVVDVLAYSQTLPEK
jgi:thiosulfate dehydrogenase